MLTRRFLIALWLAMLNCWGCRTEQENTQVHNLQLVKQLNAYINQHNWQAMAKCYADSVQQRHPHTAHWMQSKQTCIEPYRRLQQQYPNLTQRIVQLYASGNNHVVMEALIEGKTPSDSVVRHYSCVIFTIERHRIIKEYSYPSFSSI